MSSPQATPEPKPQLPSFILLSQSSLPQPTGPTLGGAFVHPEIIYHFADDPPLSLVPADDRDVMVMDYDPASTELPKVRSLSPNVAVKGVHVDHESGRPDGMLVVETVSLTPVAIAGDSSAGLSPDPSVTLTRFSQRTALLRDVLDYRPACDGVTATMSPEKPLDQMSVSPTSTL